MLSLEKKWDEHVLHAEILARNSGFQALRDHIVRLADLKPGDLVIDVGSGTGLLALAVAPRVQQIWGIDSAPAMTAYLEAKAASADIHNLRAVTASAACLPLIDHSVDKVVSNYCLHHLDADGKRHALTEAFRVLRPGGRLVFADMMFTVALRDARDRQVIASKVRAMLRHGRPGLVRLARNGLRLASGQWEQPAPAEWWRTALTEAGFVDVQVTALDHEGGIASATKPGPTAS